MIIYRDGQAIELTESELRQAQFEANSRRFKMGYAVILKLTENHHREIYPCVVEDEYVFHKGWGLYRVTVVADTEEEAVMLARQKLIEYKNKKEN